MPPCTAFVPRGLQGTTSDPPAHDLAPHRGGSSSPVVLANVLECPGPAGPCADPESVLRPGAQTCSSTSGALCAAHGASLQARGGNPSPGSRRLLGILIQMLILASQVSTASLLTLLFHMLRAIRKKYIKGFRGNSVRKTSLKEMRCVTRRRGMETRQPETAAVLSGSPGARGPGPAAARPGQRCHLRARSGWSGWGLGP